MEGAVGDLLMHGDTGLAQPLADPACQRAHRFVAMLELVEGSHSFSSPALETTGSRHGTALARKRCSFYATG